MLLTNRLAPTLAVLAVLAFGGTAHAADPAKKEIVFGATAGPYSDQIKLGIKPILEKQGYTVKVDLPSLGYHDQLIVQVTLDSHSEETLYEFGRALESIPEVLEASLISGDYDYFLRIAVKDTRDYERLLRERLYKIPGIRHSKSSFVLRTLKKVDTPLMK